MSQIYAAHLVRLPWTRNKEGKIERRRRCCENGSKPPFAGGVGFLFRGAALRPLRVIPTPFRTILRNKRENVQMSQ